MIQEAVARVTRLPRDMWDEEIRAEARAFTGVAHDRFMQAMEIAMMNTGGGLDMSRSTRDLVIQGQVQDPDLATAEVVIGQPVAPPSPTTTVTTTEWDRTSEDPWYDRRPRTPEIHES